MDLDWTADEEGFRKAVRDWLERHVPAEPFASQDTRAGFGQHVEWEQMLFEAGYAAVSWPKKYGGLGASLMKWLIFEEEYYRAGAPGRVTQNGLFLLAPTLFEFGTPEQRDRHLEDICAAKTLWAQAWSEPNAGSDLAAVQARAVPDGDGFRLFGQKTWCTRGAFCDGVFGLFRTDASQQRHRGLSYLMVPLHQEGVTVRPVQRFDGDEGFAEIFFDGAYVAKDHLIGQENEGWRVAMATTSSERGLSLRSPGRFLATCDRLISLYRSLTNPDPEWLGRLLDCYRKAHAYRDYTFQTVSRMEAGEKIGAESSLSKLHWSELDLELHELALIFLGTDAETAVTGTSRWDDRSGWMKSYQFALAGPIYAGTNEIQKNIIAERLLGLPRHTSKAK